MRILKCPVCSQNFKVYGIRFRRCCSVKCSSKDPIKLKNIGDAHRGIKMPEGVGYKIAKKRMESYRLGKWRHPRNQLGKSRTEKERDSISKGLKNAYRQGRRRKRKIDRKKMSDTTRNLWKNKEYRDKIVASHKKRWANKEYREFYKKKLLRALNQRPTKPEKMVMSIISKNKLPFSYVGGFNPDFIDERLKIIVEVQGSYWHNLPNMIEKDKRKFEAYKKEGFDIIEIWEHELVRDERWGKRLDGEEIIARLRGMENHS